MTNLEIVILIKPGELWLKGKNRDIFLNKLLANIQQIVQLPRENIKVGQGRIYIESPSANRGSYVEALGRVFGIHSFVVAQKITPSLKDIGETAQIFANKWAEEGFKTFKIETSRADKKFEKNSAEVDSYIGKKVLISTPTLAVDIHKPERTLRIEIRQEGCFIYELEEEKIGVGGLPVGVSGRGLLLLSGGIDSPVAGWFMLKRGMSIDAVYFHSPPYTGEKAKEKVIDLTRKLALWSPDSIRLFLVNFSEIQLAVAKEVLDPYWTIEHRRFMRRIAECIAKTQGHQALITGESLGQVASQTIENISIVENGSGLPILRPLVGFDKSETIRVAKEIDMFEISIRPYDDCCVLFASKRPKTKARIEDIVKLEKKISGEKLIEKAFKDIEIITVTHTRTHTRVGPV